MYTPATGPAGYMFIQYLDLLVCPSDTAKPMTYIAPTTGPAPAQAPLSYAVNAGFLDMAATGTSSGVIYPPDYQENGVFFSQAASVFALPAQTPTASNPQQNPIKTDLGYISRYDGTGTTLLFGENMDASFWAHYNGTNTAPVSFVPYDSLHHNDATQATKTRRPSPGSICQTRRCRPPPRPRRQPSV